MAASLFNKAPRLLLASSNSLRALSTTTRKSLEELQTSEFYRKKLRQAAKIMDTNKDGVITRADYDLILKRYEAFGVSSAQMEGLKTSFCNLCDLIGLSDSTKSLTYDQYAETFMRVIGELNDHELFISSSFSSVDIDGDGEISPKEWEEMCSCYNIAPEHSRASFSAMDTNGDGRIGRDEYGAYIMEYFYSDEDKLKSSILYGPLQ